MFNSTHFRADIARWGASFSWVVIGKMLLLCVLPLSLLIGYAKIQSNKRHAAEAEVAQLTQTVSSLRTMFRRVEQHNAQQRERSHEQIVQTKTIANTQDDVLDAVVPATVADLVRID